mmetsp:Transcript_84546/g.239825  ORF Transcript_84546/g.239825 Transcript_84546/m.239825 type:complete len:286 (-) Transcript_84546:119-976(-)
MLTRVPGVTQGIVIPSPNPVEAMLAVGLRGTTIEGTSHRSITSSSTTARSLSSCSATTYSAASPPCWQVLCGDRGCGSNALKGSRTMSSAAEESILALELENACSWWRQVSPDESWSLVPQLMAVLAVDAMSPRRRTPERMSASMPCRSTEFLVDARLVVGLAGLAPVSMSCSGAESSAVEIRLVLRLSEMARRTRSCCKREPLDVDAALDVGLPGAMVIRDMPFWGSASSTDTWLPTSLALSDTMLSVEITVQVMPLGSEKFDSSGLKPDLGPSPRSVLWDELV